tara:strand:+ start:245 stop:937 length:693 start_codon:yes stop_codon:yes gene_type:complete
METKSLIFSKPTFIRRRGRMTKAQLGALDRVDPFLMDPIVDAMAVFNRQAPMALEIGFGMGQTLVHFAGCHPEWNCIGVDVYRPGIGSLVLQCEQQNIKNVRIVEADALSVLERLEDNSIELMMVFFPDPWPKKRHHKRRLVTPAFGTLASSKLNVGGRLLLATDWSPYAETIDESLQGNPELRGGISERWPLRPQTKFEERARRRRHRVQDFCYTKIDNGEIGSIENAQ